MIAKVTAWRLQPAAVFYQVDGLKLPVLNKPKSAQVQQPEYTKQDTFQPVKKEPVDESKLSFVVNADTDLIRQHLNQQTAQTVSPRKKDVETDIAMPLKPIFKSSTTPYYNENQDYPHNVETIKKYAEMNLVANESMTIQEIRSSKSPEPMDVSNDDHTPTTLIYSPKPKLQPTTSGVSPGSTSRITPQSTPRQNTEQKHSGKNYQEKVITLNR